MSLPGEMAPEVLEWIAAAVLPHEPAVRAWLRRKGVIQADEDDLIQEAYARLGRVTQPRNIISARAYFFTVVRNLIAERLRRERVVRIELAETQLLCIEDDEPSPEQRFSARQQLALVQRFIEELPEPCRSVVRLRKIVGLPQRETAQRLGLTENQVEKQVASAIRSLLGRLKALDAAYDAAPRPRYDRDPQRNRRRDR